MPLMSLPTLPSQMDTDPSKQRPDASAILENIKPKPEPRVGDGDGDSDSPPPASDEDCEVTPLSGDHPFFTTVMSRSHVQGPFQLTIPLRFQRHLPAVRVPAVLLRGGRAWAASYRGDLRCKKLGAAWRDFAVGNRLRVGDACVFELVPAQLAGGGGGGEEGNKGEAVVFRVQVLRGGMPEEVTSKGAAADDPMVILD
ncbi:hypothetical protein ACP4OV_017354 [Aristida adscensionis]